MSDASSPAAAATARIANVKTCLRAMERAVTRPLHLPGLVGFYGPSGVGKSFAAAYAASEHHAYYLECRDSWSRKYFLEKLLEEMRIKPKRTIPELCSQASEQLALSGRPLIVDEADKLIDRGYVEVIRDLHEGAGGAAILLIGEEQMEMKLRPFERVHNRMLAWEPALLSGLDDARMLATLYCPGLKLADDLLALVVRSVGGITRRICVNLELIQQEADKDAPQDGELTRAWWAGRALYTGAAVRHPDKRS